MVLLISIANIYEIKRDTKVLHNKYLSLKKTKSIMNSHKSNGKTIGIFYSYYKL